jgi:inosose dehydratase
MTYRGVASMLWIYMQYQRHEDLGGCLAEVRTSGFEGVEGWCDLHFGDDARTAATAEGLRRHGLSMPSAYTGGCMHDRKRADAAISTILAQAARALAAGVGLRGVSINPDVAAKSDAELVEQSRNLERLGKSLADMGLHLGIHNHTPEIRENARELRAALAQTDPAHVGLCLDVEWVRRGGLDPITFLDEYKDRVRALHLRQSHGGVWAEAFEDGDIDYRAIDRLLRQAGFDGWLIVENSHEARTAASRPLAEVQTESRRYVRAVFSA